MKGLLLRLVVLWLLATASLAGALLGGGKAAWMVCCSMVLLALFATIGSLVVKGEIAISRWLPSVQLTNGDELRIEGGMELPFRLPWVFVSMTEVWRNERTLRTVQGTAIVMPFGRKRAAFAYVIPRLERGVYTLQSIETAIDDFLFFSGFRARRASFAETTDSKAITVYPSILEESEQRRRLHVDDNPVLLGGLREYAPGDSLRRIDWKSYLRQGKLMTKLSEPDEETRIELLLDPSANEEQFERVVSAAAGVVRNIRLLSSASGVGLGMLGDQQAEGDLATLMGHLAMVCRLPQETLMQSVRDAAAQWTTYAYRELWLITGRLDAELLQMVGWIRNVLSVSVRVTVLYASNRTSLTAEERRLLSALDGEGCTFGIIVNEVQSSAFFEREGVLRYG